MSTGPAFQKTTPPNIDIRFNFRSHPEGMKVKFICMVDR